MQLFFRCSTSLVVVDMILTVSRKSSRIIELAKHVFCVLMQEIVGEGEEYVPYMFRPFTSHVVLKKLSKSIYFRNT